MATNKEKMTKKEMYMALLQMDEVKANEKIVEGLQHEIDLLEKKSGAEKKPTANQKENEGYKEVILEYLATAEKGKAVRDMMVEIPAFEGVSKNRVTALVTALHKEGLIQRETIKKINYYTLVDIESGE